jgi:hypothetical protein
MAETVKTRDGTVDDPLFVRDLSSELSRPHIFIPIQTARLSSGENSSETMTYLTLVALMMLVLSPVLVPLVITGVHTIANLLTA